MPRIPKIFQEDGVTIVAFGQEFDSIDIADTEAIGTLLSETVEKAQSPRLAIDLSHTRMCCSQFVGVLIRTWKQLEGRGTTRFGLIGLQDEIREILEATQLDKLWEQFDSREQLVEEFSTD